jgi:outer membrane biosynthesis protein TonB
MIRRNRLVMNKLMQIIYILKSHLGISLSSFLHLILFIIILINFPQCNHKPAPEVIISIDLLPISKNTNVENKQVSKPKKEEKPIEKPKDTPKEMPQPKSEQVPTLEEKQEPIPEPKKLERIEPKKEVVKKPSPAKAKTEPKKDDKKKKQKPKLSEMDKLLKNLQAESEVNDLKENIADKPSKGPYNPDMPLSMSVKDSIRRQVEKCWNPPAGNKDAAKLQILLRIAFKQDGSVSQVIIVETHRYNSDELYRVAADSAVRAVHKASPLQDLPLDQYNIWKDLEFNFNPSGILGD